MNEENEVGTTFKNLEKFLKNIFKGVFKNKIKFVLIVFSFILVFFMVWWETEKASAQSAAKTAKSISEATSITEDGEIKINADVYDTIRKDLEELGIDPKSYYLNDKYDYLEKMVQAEIVNNYPDTDVGEIRGIIKVKRSLEDGSTIDLNFEKFTDFENRYNTAITESEINELLTKFTLDTDNNIVVAKTNKTVIKDEKNNIIISETYDKGKETINYKEQVSQYTVPYEFLFILMQVTKNPEYVMAVTDLIMKESHIDFTVMDSKTIITEIDEYMYDEEYYEKKDTYEGIDFKSTTGDIITGRTDDISESKISKTTEISSINVGITKVKTWVYDNDITYNLTTSPETVDGPTEIKQVPEDDINISYNRTGIIDNGDGSHTFEFAGTKKVNKRNIYTYKTSTKTWSKASENGKIDVNSFLGLWKNEDGTYDKNNLKPFKSDGKKVGYVVPDTKETTYPVDNIVPTPDVLFELLATNERTQSHEQIMRYILYVYTGKDYGVTDLEAVIGETEMISVETSNNSLYFPISSKTIETIDGKKFGKGADIQPVHYSAGFPRYASGDAHWGQDIAPNDGHKSDVIYIIAAADGIVKNADKGYSNNYGDTSKANNWGWGNRVFIEHTALGIYTNYAHLEQVLVSVNEEVKQGQIIGIMGNTGNSNGKHLHFEVWLDGSNSDSRVDPLKNYISITNPRPSSESSSSGDSQTFLHSGKTIKYDATFANKTEKPTSEMIEKTYTAKTTCYDLCYFCCEKEETDSEFGKTASGMVLKGGEKIVAADTKTLPFGTWIYIDNPTGKDPGYYMVADKGGAIKGTRIDIFMGQQGDKIGDASGGTAAHPKKRTNLLECSSQLFKSKY